MQGHAGLPFSMLRLGTLLKPGPTFSCKYNVFRICKCISLPQRAVNVVYSGDMKRLTWWASKGYS